MNAQSYHHGNLRQTLLKSAAAAIEEGGIEALSLRQLARKAGVSHAAPGRHFRDKQALLDALAEDGFHRLADELAVIIEQPPQSVEQAHEQFGKLTRCYIDFSQTQPTLLALMFGMKHAPDARTELLEAGHASMDITRAAVENMQAVGAIRVGDPSRIAQVIFACVHGVATLISAGFVDPDAYETLIEDSLDALWKGLQ